MLDGGAAGFPHGPQGGSTSPGRTVELRRAIRKALDDLGVKSYIVAFSDPDTPNWTWAAGHDDLQAMGMGRMACNDLERALTTAPEAT